MDLEKINSAPLEACLQKIDAMMRPGASGVQEMRDLLWAIKDEIDAAMIAFRDNITVAQDAELAALRRLAAS